MAACSSGGNLAVFCGEDIGINEGFTKTFSSIPELQGGPDSPKPSPETIKKFKAAYAQNIGPHIKKAQENAPSEIKSELGIAAAGAKKMGEGDLGVFEQDKKLQENVVKVDNFAFDKCSGQKADVTAINYSFQNAPKEAKAGVFRVKLTNKGTEPHMIAVLKRNPGVTDSFADIVKLPKEQGQAKTETLAETFVDPGQTDSTSLNLPAGDYLLACFVRQGSGGGKEGTGPPHAVIGMRQELKVT